MEKAELLNELETKFKEIKEELGFKSTLEEINEIFFIQDHIIEKGYVSEQFSRQLCSRIVDLYVGWCGYLHNLVMPNPSSMIGISESQYFDDDKKQEITNTLTRIMALTSKNILIGVTKDKSEEAKFIVYSSQGGVVRESLALTVEYKRKIQDYLLENTRDGIWPVSREELSAKLFFSSFFTRRVTPGMAESTFLSSFISA